MNELEIVSFILTHFAAFICQGGESILLNLKKVDSQELETTFFRPTQEAQNTFHRGKMFCPHQTI